MTGAGLWLQLMLPATLLVVGHLLLTTKRYLVTERGKEKADVEGAESNRMLGLAFQQQGQLDMAFDKFRKCPYDEQLGENLYALALDFERRRQFNKAESVFGFIHKVRPQVQGRGRAHAARQDHERDDHPGGSSAARSTAATMVLQGAAAEKPMLGRYQVEKELGKGAMGVVYLGKDPKIGRTVAIKTLALSSGVRGRRAAGGQGALLPRGGDGRAPARTRTSSPSTTRARSTTSPTSPWSSSRARTSCPTSSRPNLLPRDQGALDRRAVADALGYAHTMGVVHRDIKPANIMYEPESDTPKVTDFGIARITDSSKTKTGMVLGTPSYMSPEQLAGKKIDGRSDLFSLGVTLFQMLCGRLPFEGESMTQLMFAIASNPHPHIREINPDLPPWIDAIIDKALAKDFNQRYQTGQEFAEAIRQARGLKARTAKRCHFPNPARSASPCTGARSRSSATGARTASTTSRGASSTARTWSFPWAAAAGRPARRFTTCGCRITVDRELRIVDAAAATDAMPYAGACDAITPDYAKLVGLSIGPGYLRHVKERLGGVLGCTHLTELAAVARDGRLPDLRGPGARPARPQAPAARQLPRARLARRGRGAVLPALVPGGHPRRA